MTETLAPQNEPQPWKQELKLHPEGYPALKPEETLALVGSWTESKLEDTLESLKDSPEAEQERQTKVLRAALSELPNLDAQFGVLQAIADRKSQVENQLKEASERRNVRVSTELRTKIAGLDFLLGEYDGIEDNIKLSGQTSRERSMYVNELITEHNERVSGDSESIADSPEVQEAQARINARYAEQTKQPQQSETVDDARQKVAESFGGTGEKERQALIGEVAQAAKHTAHIYSSVTKRSDLRFKDGSKQSSIDGFDSFGDALQWGDFQWKDRRLSLQDSPEAFLFEPAVETRYKTEVVDEQWAGRFGRTKTVKKEEQVPDGEVQLMVANPKTGQREPGVKVAYQFNSNSGSGYSAEYPAYNAPDNNRGGNQLTVEVTLPKSVADKLKDEVLNNPSLARDFAERLVTDNGGTEATVKMPPYAELPDNWEMTVADLQKDAKYGNVRHNVISRRNVSVGR